MIPRPSEEQRQRKLICTLAKTANEGENVSESVPIIDDL